MTSIVYHKCHRTGWRQVRHSFLLDIGSRIEIRLVPSSPSTVPLFDHTHTATRYFEIEIDEVRARGKKTFIFQNIFPVHARRRPDWHLLNIRIRHGSWTITGRIPNHLTSHEHQWIYTDDFNILFLSSGGRHDLDMLLNLITARLDAIAVSIRSGTRVLSQFESQQVCRDAFGSLFSNGIDGAFRDTVLYREHSTALSGVQSAPGTKPDAREICRTHGTIAADIRQGADMSIDLDQIGELKDLSWLND
jgi:hypothetical protein